MHQPTYRQALLEAWRLVYKNTGLWLLGLLSVLFAGSFGLSNFISQMMITMGSGGQASWLLNWHWPGLGVSTVPSVIWLVWLTGVLCVIALAVIYISVTAKAALLIAVADFYKKETMPKISKIWNTGLKFFWRIFTIEVIRKIALLLTVFIFGIIWIKLPYSKNNWYLIIDIVMLGFTILLGWIISAVTIFASGYTVIDDKSLISSFKKSWKLLHTHLLVSFEISAILTVLDFLLIIFFAVLISYSFIPAVFVWLIAGAFGSAALAVFGAIFGFVLLLILITIFGAIYNTYYMSVWMYLFMKMHHEGIFSRIIHHAGGLFKK